MIEPKRTIRLGGRDFDEARLIAALRSKDLEATRRLIRQLIDDRDRQTSTGLEVVVQAFGRELHTFISRLLGLDREATWDVYSDWLERILTRASTYDASRSAFRTWLYQEAKYAVVAWRRREARAPEPIDPDSVSSATAVPDDLTPDPLTIAQKRALNRAFQRLRPAQRELLWWRYVEGFMPYEIAHVKLGDSVPHDHVKVYVARAVAKLAALYEEESR